MQQSFMAWYVCVLLCAQHLSVRCVVQHDQQRYGVCDPGAFLVWTRRDYHSIVCSTGKCAVYCLPAAPHYGVRYRVCSTAKHR